MAKQKQLYVCDNCNFESPKWLGQCPSCKSWNTFVEKDTVELERKAARLSVVDTLEAVNLADVSEQQQVRFSSGLKEFDSVVGGGVMSDQVILLSGEPGVGKSTLLLQIAYNLALADKSCLYISAEESAGQVASRARRLFGKNLEKATNLSFLNAAGLGNIQDQIDKIKPKVVVLDSVQTIYDEEITGSAGNVSQVRSVAAKMVYKAKRDGFLLVMIGHITKEGEIAGPKLLEHLVDTVLNFEGDQQFDYRILRSYKNRFGQVGEVGILMMQEGGLMDITPETNVFIDASATESIGVARTVVMDGNRPLLIEVQALVSPTVFAYPKRVAEGLSINRLQTICAIVSKFSNAKLSDSDVYVRVTGGYLVKDTVVDLALAAALISSAQKAPLSANDIYLGELSLAGKIIAVPRLASRLKEASRFGAKRLVAMVGYGAKPGMTAQSIDSLTKLKLK